jgi:uncharacterized protein YjdB
MPFTFKLSQRLARMRWGVVLLSTAALAACEKPLSVFVGPKSPAPVASVAIAPPSLNLTVGSIQQLSTVLKDASGNVLASRSVTWTSSSLTVATVSASGVATGMAPGLATLTATSEGRSGTATAGVSNAPVAAVTVSPATAGVTVGQTVQLTATPKDASGNALTGRVVTWASSAPAVATVSGTGLVSGVAAGTATIAATSEGQSGPAAITVSAVPVASVAVSPATAGVTVGQTVQLTATPKDASGNALTGRVVIWTTSAPAVATVSGTGLVSGVAAGSATVTATSEGKSATATLTVTAPVNNPGTVTDLAVSGVTDTSATLTFTEVTDGTGLPASYDVRLAAGTISWAFAASVIRGSCATPVAGTAIGAKRTCTVLGLAASTRYQVQAVAFRGTLGVNAVLGSLSNVASGTTASSTAPVASVTLSPASASVAVGGTQQFTAILKDAKGNPLTGRIVTWASGAPLLAAVSGSGLATGVATGAATITATSEGMNGSAGLTVSTAPPSHEPVGYRQLNDQPWDGIGTWQTAVNSWFYALRTSTENDDIVQDATAPRSPLNVLRIHFPPTLAANSEPSVHWMSLPTPKAIYTTWWVKLSPNWVPSPAGGGKITFLHTATGQVYTGFFGSSAPHHLSVNTEWSPYGQVIWDPNVTTTPLVYGQWYHMEWYMQWESAPGACDGIMRWWVDGVLNGDYPKTCYPPDNGFTQFEYAPTLQNPPPATQYMYVDHTYVSTP